MNSETSSLPGEDDGDEVLTETDVNYWSHEVAPDHGRSLTGGLKLAVVETDAMDAGVFIELVDDCAFVGLRVDSM